VLCEEDMDASVRAGPPTTILGRGPTVLFVEVEVFLIVLIVLLELLIGLTETGMYSFAVFLTLLAALAYVISRGVNFDLRLLAMFAVVCLYVVCLYVVMVER